MNSSVAAEIALLVLFLSLYLLLTTYTSFNRYTYKMTRTRRHTTNKVVEEKAKGMLEEYLFPKGLDDSVLLKILIKAFNTPVGKDEVIKTPNNKVL
jgi:hypothetical protein